MPGINYVKGDATQPIVDNNCPCILAGKATCGPEFCYHQTGEGNCSPCGGTGILLSTLLNSRYRLIEAGVVDAQGNVFTKQCLENIKRDIHDDTFRSRVRASRLVEQTKQKGKKKNVRRI
jgi:hypothetical protein